MTKHWVEEPCYSAQARKEIIIIVLIHICKKYDFQLRTLNQKTIFQECFHAILVHHSEK